MKLEGTKELSAPRDVVWNVGELFDFPALVESWRKRRQPLNHSEARAALQLKFVIRLEFDTTSNVTDRRPTLRWANGEGAEGARIQLCADRACLECGAALIVDPLPARPVRPAPPSRRPALSAA